MYGRTAVRPLQIMTTVQNQQLAMGPEDVATIEDRGGQIHVLISPTSVGSTKMIMGTATVPVGGKVFKPCPSSQ